VVQPAATAPVANLPNASTPGLAVAKPAVAGSATGLASSAVTPGVPSTQNRPILATSLPTAGPAPTAATGTAAPQSILLKSPAAGTAGQTAQRLVLPSQGGQQPATIVRTATGQVIVRQPVGSPPPSQLIQQATSPPTPTNQPTKYAITPQVVQQGNSMISLHFKLILI